MSNNERGRLFADACDELAAAGCRLLPMDYVDLHRLSERVVSPAASAVSLFTIPPVTVGRCVLQVPTIGAMIWWEQFGREWYGRDDVMGTIAFAYLCANGRDTMAMESLYNKRDADSALVRFRLSLCASATTAELAEGLDRLERRISAYFGSTGADADGAATAVQYGDTVARLCAAYSEISPRRVIYELSPDECVAMLRAAVKPMGISTPEHDADFAAFAEFKAYVRKLKEERKCLASE